MRRTRRKKGQVSRSMKNVDAFLDLPLPHINLAFRWELQNTSREASWRENYEAIKWTPLRSGMLADLYLNSPVSMQCNK